MEIHAQKHHFADDYGTGGEGHSRLPTDIQYAYIDQPEDEIGIATHIHPDRDQWIFLFGAKNFVEFDADAEFFLDGKWRKINYPFYTYIPKGMTHEPLRITHVGKPLIFIDARFGPNDWPMEFVGEKPRKKA